MTTGNEIHTRFTSNVRIGSDHKRVTAVDVRMASRAEERGRGDGQECGYIQYKHITLYIYIYMYTQ